jgi:hypothetical protein
MGGLGGCTIAIACLLIWPAPTYADPASATDSAAYETAIGDALQEYTAGRFAEARALFLRAHQLRPSARTLRGLGLVEYELRHYAEAMRILMRAQSDARNPLTDAQKQSAATLVKQMSVFVGRYRVVSEPTEVILSVDGAPVAASREPLVLDVGEHTLVVRAPRHRAQERRIDVKGGEQEELRFELVADGPPTAEIAKPSSAPHEIHATRAPRPSVVVHADSSSPLLSRRTTWGWVSLGVAGASLVGSLVAWRSAEAAAARWNDDARCLRDGETRQQNCGADSRAVTTARTWMTAGLVATGALGVAATLLLLPARQDADHRSDTSARCGIGPGELGVECAVGF